MLTGCIRLDACPSPAGGSCDPAANDCPKSYYCAAAEVCTRACVEAKDCWVATADGCRPKYFPLQRLPDGGTFVETSSDGYCPETQAMACLGGYCQPDTCGDAGCAYDMYGPSPFKGNRTGGPP